MCGCVCVGASEVQRREGVCVDEEGVTGERTGCVEGRARERSEERESGKDGRRRKERRESENHPCYIPIEHHSSSDDKKGPPRQPGSLAHWRALRWFAFSRSRASQQGIAAGPSTDEGCMNLLVVASLRLGIIPRWRPSVSLESSCPSTLVKVSTLLLILRMPDKHGATLRPTPLHTDPRKPSQYSPLERITSVRTDSPSLAPLLA